MSSFLLPLAVTAKGASGVLIPLGLENVFQLSTAIVLYMWLSLIILFLIAASASQRNASFFGVLLPVIATFEVWSGWLQFPNPATGWGIVIVVTILAVALYMKDRLHATFGVAGPGSMVMNILMFIIILQTVVGFVNGIGIFDTNVAATPTQYQNVDLKTSIPGINNTGGFLDQAWSTLTLLTEATISAIRLLLSIAEAIVLFSVVLAGTFPFLVNPAGIAALAALQVGIYYIYVIWYVNFIRPTYNSLDV
jgi:hypothetical protein